jgi:hypothetical protein
MPSDAPTHWIDPQYDLPNTVGTSGFLIRFDHENTGGASYALRDTPAHTNRSRVAKLTGWCGSTNNLATTALGVWTIIRVAKNGRLLVQEMTDPAALATFLDEMGYPELGEAGA